MFGFGKKTDNSQIVLTISIESSHVRAGLVRFGDGGKPVLLKQVIQDFIFENSYTKSIANIQKTIDSSLHEIVKGLSQKISHTVCVLGSPWYVSRTHTHTIERDNPFVFDYHNSKEILTNEAKEFVRFAKQNFFSSSSVSVIEKKIIKLGVNGYSVDSIPDSQEVRRVDVTSYVGLAPAKLLADIEEAIHRHVVEDVKFTTSDLAHFLVVRDVFSSISEFLLLSTSGEQSELLMVEDDALLSVATIPVGISVVHKHSENAGVHKHAVFHSFKDENVNHDTGISQAHQASAREWQQAFTDAVQKISQNHPVPDLVIVITDKSSEAWVHHVVTDSHNKHLSASGQNFRAILMDIESISSFIGSKVSHTDLKLMVYSLYSVLVV